MKPDDASAQSSTPPPSHDGSVPVHPVQTPGKGYGAQRAYVAQAVTMLAYEVYRAVYGEQKALVTGDCRGGFSTGELIAFLYAHSFPREEWGERVDAAFRGMKNL